MEVETPQRREVERRGRQAAEDGATGGSMKAFQFGIAKIRKTSWQSISEKGRKKALYRRERGPMRKQRYSVKP